MSVQVVQRIGLSFGALRLAAANPNLGRFFLSRLVQITAKWGATVALAVYAYRASGPAGVAIAAIIHLVPGAASAPFAAPLAYRFGASPVRDTCSYVRAAALAGSAALVIAGGPAAAVYALFAVIAIATSINTPLQDARLPLMSRTPGELTAANLAVSMIESGGIFLGPLISAGLLRWTSIGATLAACSAAALGAKLISDRIDVGSPRPRGGGASRFAILADIVAGARAVAGKPHLLLVVGLFAAFAVVDGALDVLITVTALRELGLGQSGVGTLTAATGLGGVAGGVVVLARLRRGRPGSDLVVGMAVLGLPLVLLGLLSYIPTAFVLLGVFGIGLTLIQVSVATLLQRATPDPDLPHVLGLLESVFVIGLAAGTLSAPAVVDALGVTGALIAFGALTPVLAILSVARLRHLDSLTPMPYGIVDVLAAIPVFAPLPDATLESLAHGLQPVELRAGATVFEQGDDGDAYFVVYSGEVEVVIDGARVRLLGPGGAFGEIALLRDVPRTATIRVTQDALLMRLERDRFLAAVTGNPASADAADQLVGMHLGRGGFGIR